MSRELDAKVAMELFGFTAPRGLWCNSQGQYEGLPPYSTDIAAAFKVVAKMRELGFEPSINTHGPKDWCVEIIREDPSDNYERELQQYGYGELPYAICIASLYAIAASKGEKELQAMDAALSALGKEARK